MLPCSTKTYLEGNVWIRRMEFAHAEMIKEGHIHEFDHITMVVTGEVKAYEVKSGQCLGTYSATSNNIIYVPKGMAHSIVSTKPNTIALCIQAMRDEDTKEVLETDFQNPKWSPSKLRIRVTQIPVNERKRGL